MVEVSEANEVSHFVRTAVHTHLVTLHRSVVVEQLILPVRAGIGSYLLEVRSTAVVQSCFVQDSLIPRPVQHGFLLPRVLKSHRHIITDMRTLVEFATLGGNEYNAVGALRSVDSG